MGYGGTGEEIMEKNKRVFKKKYVKSILVGLLSILLVPLIVSFLMESPLMNWGSQKAESWMSFWGGYLGAILGIIGAITATTLQIKSQTNQIVLAAKENDRLERIRIGLNLIIDKNIELFRYFLELEKELNKYSHVLKILINEQIYLPQALKKIGMLNENLMNNGHQFSQVKTENETALIQTLGKEYDEKVDKIQTLKKELNQQIAVMRSLSSSISASLFYIDDKNETYFKSIENYVENFNYEIESTSNYILYDEIDDLNDIKTNLRMKELEESVVKLKILGDNCKGDYSDFMASLIKKIVNQNK